MLNTKHHATGFFGRMTAVALLSIVVGTTATLAANGKGEHAYADPGVRQNLSSIKEGPLQDPRDAWDGYFANPDSNPNYHGSNGG